MVSKNKLRDAPFRVIHIYQDGREVCESQHISITVAIRMAEKYKREVPTNKYAIQARTVISTKKSIEYKWRTLKTL